MSWLSFPIEVFCGKMLIQPSQKILWECAYSVKTEWKQSYLTSCPSCKSAQLPCGSTHGDLQAVCIVFDQRGSSLSSRCPDTKTWVSWASQQPVWCICRIAMCSYIRDQYLWLLEQSVNRGDVWLLFCLVITDVLINYSETDFSLQNLWNFCLLFQ